MKGHPLLARKTKRVALTSIKDGKWALIIQNMRSTMKKAQGVGLAANQVAQGIQLILLESRKNKRYPWAPSFPLHVYFNPKILHRSRGQQWDWEGCLSIPGYRGRVPRSQTITFEAWLPNAKKVIRTVRGFEARVLQHEVDHLNGLFYVDRMKNLKSWVHTDQFDENQEI